MIQNVKMNRNMGTVDSGNETLFSDDSSVDLVASPDPCPIRRAVHARVTESPELGKCFQKDDEQELRSLPPKIQPFSGVLSNGKVVIRPIAFKPMSAQNSGRLSNIGERYGSTPVLNSRPGSHMTLYGSSSDLRPSHHHYHYSGMVSNHSLDRKMHLQSPQVSSMSSLPASVNSVHARKAAYEAIECIRKSPAVNGHLNGKLSMLSYATSNGSTNGMHQGGTGSLLDLAPSPSDSGVSELEAAMRDRDSDLNRRHNGEQGDQVTYGDQHSSKLYQEKERMWERELRRMKVVHESRLRAGAQKTLKLEQMLMMQSYQLQQDKKRLSQETDKTNREVGQLKQEADHLRARLEDTEWNLCQKTGEIALLKTQLKDAQNEHTTKGHELLQVKAEFRQMRDNLDRRDNEAAKLRLENEEKDKTKAQLQAELSKLNGRLKDSDKEVLKVKERAQCEIERLKSELKELREELSDVSLSGYDGIESGRSLRGGNFDVCKNSNGYHWNSNDSSLEDAEVRQLNGELPDMPEPCRAGAELMRIKLELTAKENEFQKERRKWSEEKEKVLRYQKQLQLNYVQMFRRSRALESDVENLTLELELSSKNAKNVNKLSKTIEL